MRCLLATLLLSCSTLAAGAHHEQGWLAASFPNPTRNAVACGRSNSSKLCDPDGVLTAKGATAIEAVLTAIHRAGEVPHRAASSAAPKLAYPVAACGEGPPRGFEVAVAVVRHAGGTGPRETRVAALAKGLHDAWGVGDACGSGLLLLLSLEDRQAFVSTGASARLAAPDAALELVVERMRPLLRAGDVDGALLHGVRDVGELLAGRLTEPHAALWPLLLLAAGGVSVVLYQRWAGERRVRHYRECVRQLSKLEADAARARAARYAATSCPVCLEDFATTGEVVAGEAAPASAAATPAAPGAPKALLPCGHAFCQTCLTRALAVKPACPICRQPTERPGPAPVAPTSSSPALGYDAFAPELAFRLNRLHVVYPDIVTRTMAERWATPGLVRPFTNDPSLLRHDPAACRAAPEPRRSASFGERTPSFGGGSSRGGGGGGGGW